MQYDTLAPYTLARTHQALPALSSPRCVLARTVNDDIQGTGAVVTSGFINGLKYQRTRREDARIVFYGAGSSAVGVADQIAFYVRQVGRRRTG